MIRVEDLHISSLHAFSNFVEIPSCPQLFSHVAACIYSRSSRMCKHNIYIYIFIYSIYLYACIIILCTHNYYFSCCFFLSSVTLTIISYSIDICFTFEFIILYHVPLPYMYTK